MNEVDLDVVEFGDLRFCVRFVDLSLKFVGLGFSIGGIVNKYERGYDGGGWLVWVGWWIVVVKVE